MQLQLGEHGHSGLCHTPHRSRQSGDPKSSRLRNFSTVCCPVLVLGAALLYTLRVSNPRRDCRKRNRCLVLQSTSGTVPSWEKLILLAGERPDIQFCVKEGVENTSARHMQRAKRICRYLMGTRDWTLTPELWKDVDTLQMLVDSDWATDKVDRRSTPAGAHNSVAVQSSVTAEHRHRRLCPQRRQKDMPSGAGHAMDASSVLWRENWA